MLRRWSGWRQVVLCMRGEVRCRIAAIRDGWKLLWLRIIEHLEDKKSVLQCAWLIYALLTSPFPMYLSQCDLAPGNSHFDKNHPVHTPRLTLTVLYKLFSPH